MTGLNIPQNTTLVHSINDITLISLDERKLASALKVWIRLVLSRVWTTGVGAAGARLRASGVV